MNLAKYNERGAKKLAVSTHLEQSRLGAMLSATTDPVLLARYGKLSPGDVGVKGIENVPMSVQVRRFEVLESFLAAGIPVAKVNVKKLRAVLEQGSSKLTESSKLVENYLEPILAKEFAAIKEEVGDNVIGVYTDATTQLGEAFAILIRWVDEHIKVQTRLIEVNGLSFASTTRTWPRPSSGRL